MTTGKETKAKLEFAFHCHHDILIEYVSDYAERVKYIEENKPSDEQEIRLRLFKVIPEDRLSSGLKKARAEWEKARAEWNKACAERDKARAEWDKACAEREKAYAEWDKARAEWDKACAERNKADIDKLHKELCPNCPWDGKTIFPEGIKNKGGKAK